MHITDRRGKFIVAKGQVINYLREMTDFTTESDGYPIQARLLNVKLPDDNSRYGRAVAVSSLSQM